MGLEFVEDRGQKQPAPDLTMGIARRTCAQGVVCCRVGFHGNAARVRPPLVITPEQAERSCDALGSVLSACDRATKGASGSPVDGARRRLARTNRAVSCLIPRIRAQIALLQHTGARTPEVYR